MSRHLLKRMFGGVNGGVFTWTDAKATIYKDEFAIIEVAGAGSAIVDLKPPSLVFAAFDLTCEEALVKWPNPAAWKNCGLTSRNTRSCWRVSSSAPA